MLRGYDYDQPPLSSAATFTWRDFFSASSFSRSSSSSFSCLCRSSHSSLILFYMSNSYSTTIQSLIKHTCQSAGGPNLTHGGSYGEEDGEAGLREGMGKITCLKVSLKRGKRRRWAIANFEIEHIPYCRCCKTEASAAYDDENCRQRKLVSKRSICTVLYAESHSPLECSVWHMLMGSPATHTWIRTQNDHRAFTPHFVRYPVLIFHPTNRKLSWPGWLVKHKVDGHLKMATTPVLTGLDVKRLRWSSNMATAAFLFSSISITPQ